MVEIFNLYMLAGERKTIKPNLWGAVWIVFTVAGMMWPDLALAVFMRPPQDLTK